MPLHMTKIAFRAESVDEIREWMADKEGEGEKRLTTRYLPKRAAEMEGGSLYWIFGNKLVGRSPILGFTEREDGKHWIRLAPILIPVAPRPKRAHQGWRYLEQKDAPPDLGGLSDGDPLPGDMAAELGKLGLI
ncbi:MAG: DUF1489 domain-containing protein [Sphingobium sp.]|nr:DUF1489 domain-containing protein [Sphingobium sp.]